MLQIVIPKSELYDNERNEFVYIDECKITLEHSLVSISKWESKWHKPFLSSEKTYEETIDYIRCMTLTQNVKPETYLAITADNLAEIEKYVEDPMTATWFNDRRNESNNRSSKRVITSEIIYYWMISKGVPMECQKWHINRLLTLIRVIDVSESSNKMSKSDLVKYNKALNASRKTRLNTTG